MPTVQIRDVPEDTHRELRARASAAGLSLSTYLRLEIERLASRPSIVDALRALDAHRIHLTADDVVEAVRHDRDEQH